MVTSMPINLQKNAGTQVFYVYSEPIKSLFEFRPWFKSIIFGSLCTTMRKQGAHMDNFPQNTLWDAPTVVCRQPSYVKYTQIE